MSNQRKRLNGGEREDEDEDDAEGIGEWERAYVDDRSWEALQEDESGLLRPIDNSAVYHAQYRRRLRMLSAAAAGTRIQKGLIRYLYIVIDFSRNGVAHTLTDLGGSPETHIKALMGKLEASDGSSLQNSVERVREHLNQVPSYGHCEVLILYSALCTCDPGDIMEIIQKCKKSKLRCSVVGLSAEMFICKHLCQETGGVYSVAVDEVHLKDLLLEHAPPPPAIAEFAIANLIKMGFPQRAAEGSMAICSCHKEVKIGAGYMCPRCKARVCDLPTECTICGLTLVSSPHLARSYHHLFPIAPFDEVLALSSLSDNRRKLGKSCFGCQQSLIGAGNKPGPCVTCRKCKHYFCLDCDIYIHESLHNCPGCESIHRPKSVSLMEE